MIRLNDCLIKFKLDIGVDVNVLPLRYLKYIKGVKIQVGGIPPQIYSGSDSKYKGICDRVAMCQNEITTLKFFVIDTQYEALLGLSIYLKLNLIKRVRIKQTENQKFIAKNLDIFEELGCYVENLEIKLREDAQPTVRPVRRIPLSLTNRVKR